MTDKARSSSLSLGSNKTPNLDYDQVYMLYQDGLSIPTRELHSKCSTSHTLGEAPDALVILYVGIDTREPRLPYVTGDTRSLRLGCNSSRAPVWFTDAQSSNAQVAHVAIIYHQCCEHGHTSPQCQLSLRATPHLFAKYEALNPRKMNCSPIASYMRSMMGYFNVLPHTPHAPSKRIEGSSGCVRGPTHRLDGHTDRIPNPQPGRAFVARATRSGSD